MKSKWSFEPLQLKGAFLISPFCQDDNRGAFIKDYSKDLFAQNGLNHSLKEVFYTISHKGVIRAIHFQKIKQQAKLVRCIKGKIFDVIVDLRKDSPTFKKWLGFYLSEDNFVQIYVPEGFGHGYIVIEDSIVSYKCNENFYPEYDDGIKYDDSVIDIKWPYDQIGGKEKIIISDKDQNLKSVEEYFSEV